MWEHCRNMYGQSKLSVFDAGITACTFTATSSRWLSPANQRLEISTWPFWE